MLVLKYLAHTLHNFSVYCDVNWISKSHGRIRWIECYGLKRHFTIDYQHTQESIETIILHSAVHVYRN